MLVIVRYISCWFMCNAAFVCSECCVLDALFIDTWFNLHSPTPFLPVKVGQNAVCHQTAVAHHFHDRELSMLSLFPQLAKEALTLYRQRPRSCPPSASLPSRRRSQAQPPPQLPPRARRARRRRKYLPPLPRDEGRSSPSGVTCPQPRQGRIAPQWLGRRTGGALRRRELRVASVPF